MNFKKIVNILAWIAIPAIAFGYISNQKFCIDVTCTDLTLYSLVPVGFFILLISSISKKDYQTSVVILIVTILAVQSFLGLYQRRQQPWVHPPAPILDR